MLERIHNNSFSKSGDPNWLLFATDQSLTWCPSVILIYNFHTSQLVDLGILLVMFWTPTLDEKGSLRQMNRIVNPFSWINCLIIISFSLTDVLLGIAVCWFFSSYRLTLLGIKLYKLNTVNTGREKYVYHLNFTV